MVSDLVPCRVQSSTPSVLYAKLQQRRTHFKHYCLVNGTHFRGNRFSTSYGIPSVTLCLPGAQGCSCVAILYPKFHVALISNTETACQCRQCFSLRGEKTEVHSLPTPISHRSPGVGLDCMQHTERVLSGVTSLRLPRLVHLPLNICPHV